MRNLIKPGDVVIDIGANLGYYSVIFCKAVGKTGRVVAVEPVSLYADILKGNLSSYSNIEILPFALGKENNITVQMGIPGNDKFRHGLTRIMNSNHSEEEIIGSATMFNPEFLFGEYSRINYVKCDVEGYEANIFTEMQAIIKQHMPILQIEVAEVNKELIFSMLKNIGYSIYTLNNKKKLIEIDYNDKENVGDIFFLPPKS